MIVFFEADFVDVLTIVGLVKILGVYVGTGRRKRRKSERRK